ncbi:MAG TPA: MtrB/PioB family outer membrane beta-barrel protein [Vicinamibacterales bacterium]|nr:MtrB/PioB family outer membrane beta-barrel protein [Vicinamibacterales bacterium]
MRTRALSLTGALLLVFAGVARAQQEQTVAAAATPAAAQAPIPSTTSSFVPNIGNIDFGFRTDNVTGDAARYSRFRDLREGAYVDRFRFTKETDIWAFRATANNVGYRDQRFNVAYQDIGKLKLNFDWNQVPLFISDSTRTLYKNNGNGVLTIDNQLQQAIQDATAIGPAARDLAITNALAQAQPYDLRSRRDIADVKLVYSTSRDIDLKFSVKSAHRDGSNLQSFGFGTSPGLNPVVEFGVPLNDRTTDIKSSIELANQQGLLSVGYNASWFDNHIPTVQFDNPLRVVDSPTAGPASGLAVMWPTNHAFSVNVNGSYKLPARSRASAAISIGQWNQNEALVPPTVNTALVAPPLDRPSAETRADIVSMVYSFTSRPSQYIWLNARYRYYDYANKTPLFETTGLVGDFGVTTPIENEPGSIKRGTFDLDASFSPYKYLGVNFGITREDSDRTHRMFEKTAENTYRVTFDSTGNQYVTLRAKFEHSNRDGSGLEAVDGEQPDTRHFDIANRTRDRVTGTITVSPVTFFGVNASVSSGKDKYGDTGFGLRSNDNTGWSLGFDLVPAKTVSFNVDYGYEKYTALSYSRTANPLTATDTTFLDPTRDWWDNQADKVKTFTASADFVKTLPKTDIRLSSNISDGNATYVYGMKPEQKVFTTIPLTQLSPLKNKLSDVRLDVQYFVRANVAFGGAYWFEDYKVNDFALGPNTLNALNPANGTTGVFASSIYSGYLYRNYRAHTGFIRMTYLF